MDNIVIRKYANSDFDTVVSQMDNLQNYFVGIDDSQEQKTFSNLQDTQSYMNQAVKDSQEMDGIIYVAEIANEIVGFIQGVIVKHAEDVMHNLTHHKNIEGWIGLLFTEPKVRGNGVGKKLISAIEEYFKGKGCTSMRLKVASNNDLAIRVYTKYGLKPKDLEMAIDL